MFRRYIFAVLATPLVIARSYRIQRPRRGQRIINVTNRPVILMRTFRWL